MKYIKANLSDLIGKTLTKIDISDNKETMTFHTKSGKEYIFYHDQDCCESVTIYDICGNIKDLIGSTILRAEESTNSEENPPDYKSEYSEESFTWTFYKFATRKGYVDIRWYGESNGFYGEEVEFKEVIH